MPVIHHYTRMASISALGIMGASPVTTTGPTVKGNVQAETTVTGSSVWGLVVAVIVIWFFVKGL